MKSIDNNILISSDLYGFIESLHDAKKSSIGSNSEEDFVATIIRKLAKIVRQFRDENLNLLERRVELQEMLDNFFIQNKNRAITNELLLNKLHEIKFVTDSNIYKISSNDKEVSNLGLPAEIYPKAGPQLVVPADKANMVLNAANSRWGSLYEAVASSNLVQFENSNSEVKSKIIHNYAAEFIDKIISLEDATLNPISSDNISGFALTAKLGDGAIINHDRILNYVNQHSDKDRPGENSSLELRLVAITKDGKTATLTKESQSKFIGFNINQSGNLKDILFINNGLHIEFKLKDSDVVNVGELVFSKIEDVRLESSLTYIIDLEDASISAPQNKYTSYKILNAIYQGNLSCEVRGQKRILAADTTYIDSKNLVIKKLKRTALPLVREVGQHMYADKEIITIDGIAIPERILDCFITSLIGFRLHVAPKMHGDVEVAFLVRIFATINQELSIQENANKIGVMNEELRTSVNIENVIKAAKDVIFFTNTGFLDYTGSFIDIMMQRGAIAPYRVLAAQKYKTEYEKNNVNFSIKHQVPQIGAGMWAAIRDMAGLLKSKEVQIQGLNDTGWSPSPNAAVIHAMQFHLVGDVRKMQAEYRNNIKYIKTEDLLDFPMLAELSPEDKIINLDFAVHGLIAYAYPWVKHGIGCSGVKDLSDVVLMEDRATARIKAAFIRNWLLHKIITVDEVTSSIVRMGILVDKQNQENSEYQAIFASEINLKNHSQIIFDTKDPVVKAVRDVILNPLGLKNSYVEYYFYPNYKDQVSIKN